MPQLGNKKLSLKDLRKLSSKPEEGVVVTEKQPLKTLTIVEKAREEAVKNIEASKDAYASALKSIPDFTKGIASLIDTLEAPAKMLSSLQRDPLQGISTAWIAGDMEKKREENRLRKLQLEKLERKMAIDMTLPTYDIVDCVINFRGKKIQIPPDTDQELLCKVILRNKNAMSRRWNWDEIIEAWGDVPEKDDWRKVYNAGRGVNEQVEKKTTIDNFLIVKTKTLQLNPDFLQ